MRIMGKAMLAVAAVSLTALAAYRPAADIHSEYVKFLSGRDTITGYLSYPERPTPAPAVVVIHENTGLSDFARGITEDLARRGFVALAPDLLSRLGGTPATADSGRRLIGLLVPDTVTRDLDAAVAYLRGLRAVKRDAIGVIGFCWGGAQSFRYATNNPSLKAAVVCYGRAPELADVGRIRAPVLGVYAENDARINAGIGSADSAMKAAGRPYNWSIYAGVGHGFFRSRDNPAMADSAWGVVTRFFTKELGP
jgi:carboxymethylenebutenolidase